MFRSRFGRAAEWIDSGAEVLLAVLPTKTSSHAMRSRLSFEEGTGEVIAPSPRKLGKAASLLAFVQLEI